MSGRLRSVAIGAIAVGFLLARAPEALAAQGELHLFIEGPFVLCEQASTIQVLLPQVVGPGSVANAPGRHATPGVKSLLREKELGGEDKSTTYDLSWDSVSSGAMKLDTLQGYENSNLQTISLDHEKDKCAANPAYYVSITVPKPARIRPIVPVKAVVRKKGSTACAKEEEHRILGTSTELFYPDVNLQSIKLTGDKDTGWDPQVVSDDQTLTIFDRPLHPDEMDDAASRITYGAMMDMVKIDRCFEDPIAFAPAAQVTHDSQPARNKHNDCHAAQLLVCIKDNCAQPSPSASAAHP